MVETCPPTAGGCWFCKTDADHSWGFSWGFDAYFHWACAEAEGVAGEDDPVVAFERQHV
jgi:hypothetical protein